MYLSSCRRPQRDLEVGCMNACACFSRSPGIGVQRGLPHAAVLHEGSGAELQAEAEVAREANQERPPGTVRLGISDRTVCCRRVLTSPPCNKRHECKFAQGAEKKEKKKKRPRETPADLPSYFYFLLQLLCPSARRDPHNPQTKKQKGYCYGKNCGDKPITGGWICGADGLSVDALLGGQDGNGQIGQVQNGTRTDEAGGRKWDGSIWNDCIS